jgi:glycosyltransferase involved in cell wall biosynthesis
MSKKYRILHDLWISFVGGYAGIPQDTRLIFNVLAQCDALQLDGLLYTKRKHFSLRKKTQPTSREEIVNDSGRFLHDALEDLPVVQAGILNKLKLMLTAEITNTYLKRKYDLFPIDSCYQDMLWRTVFSKTLEPEARETVLTKNFYYSNIAWRDVIFAGYFNRKVFLNTEGYDYIIFPDVRPITVSPNTKKIVRYHDSFSFLCPDFFQTHHALMSVNSLNACVKDSYFACNSAPTRDTLLEIHPELEKKAFVVPPVVRPYPKVNNWEAVVQICQTRLSKQLFPTENLAQTHALLSRQEPFEYMLALSTLEPRKNYINLIRAWENLYFQYDKKIKLIIVANPGWLSEDIENAMRPHVEMGNIIHLNNVSSDELPYLFSHAVCFAALSFIEGFGSPPVEAMQCECPVLASDNPTHRWAMGDAALYIDPYDVNAITQGMANLICSPDAKALRDELIQKGLERVQCYSFDNVRNQWLALFEQLK